MQVVVDRIGGAEYVFHVMHTAPDGKRLEATKSRRLGTMFAPVAREAVAAQSGHAVLTLSLQYRIRREMTGIRRRTPVVQLTLPRELIDAVDGWAARETRRRLGARTTRSQAVRDLLVFALEAKQPVRVYRLGEEPPVDDAGGLTPQRRIAMMGELARDAYQMRGESVVPGIRRDVVRVVRRRR